MKTMKWLIRREFWEHKGAMLWAPLVAAALMLAAIVGSLLYGLSLGRFQGQITANGVSRRVSLTLADLPADKLQGFLNTAAELYLAVSAPLFVMLAATVFFYCLSALHDERRDRSILFWKSLPVSDAQTVLSKALTAAIVAPVIIIAIAVAMSVLIVLLAGIGSAFYGLNLLGPLLSNPAFYLAPLRLAGLLPVYVLWALPTIGWLLLVSSWAKSKVFLWAVGTPVLAMLVLKWIDYLLGVGINVDWFANNVVARGLLGLVPGIWLPLEQTNPALLAGPGTQGAAAMSGIFTQSWMTLATPAVWIAAIAGCGMIFAAARLRRWKDEG